MVPRHVSADPDRAAEGGGCVPQHCRRWRRDQADGIDRPRPAGPRSLWSVTEFTPGTTQLAVELPWLAKLGGRPWVLHVGTCNKRKRIDVLLDVVAAVRQTVPDLRLVKVGGEWTADHRQRIARLGLAGAITTCAG